jgi:hypothetical protein
MMENYKGIDYWVKGCREKYINLIDWEKDCVER